MRDPSRKPSNALHLLRLEELRLEAFLVREIAFDCDKVRDVARRASHGCDRHVLRVQGSVLAPVRHFAAPGVTRTDGLPHLAVKHVVLYARLEQLARIASDGITRGIAGQRRECRIDPRDSRMFIGDDDRVSRRVQRAARPGAPDIEQAEDVVERRRDRRQLRRPPMHPAFQFTMQCAQRLFDSGALRHLGVDFPFSPPRIDH